jgi:hypothetical protein
MGSAAGPDAYVGQGFWSAADGSAAYYESGAAPLRSVAVAGDLVGADAQAVYATGPAVTSGATGLWRYPLDGSSPTEIAHGATMAVGGDGWVLGYGRFDEGGYPPLIGPAGIVKLWTLFSPIDPNWNPLVMQFTALPAS